MALSQITFYSFIGSFFAWIFVWGFVPGLWIKEWFGPSIAGIASISFLIWVVLSLGKIRLWMQKRSTQFMISLAITALALLGILGTVNWLAVKTNKKKDLTANKIHSLSDQTRKILGELKDDIRIRVWTTNLSRMSANLNMDNFFEDFKLAGKGKVKIEIKNPNEDRPEAEKDAVRKDNLIIVTQFKGEQAGRESRVENFNDSKGEEQIINAVIQANKGAKKTVCFIAGHGQSSVSETTPSGLSAIKDRMEGAAYQTREITLVTSDTIPADCELLVNAGPKTAPLPADIEKIQKYLEGKHQFINMVGPGSPAAWRDLTVKYGVKIREDLIVDRRVNPPVVVATQNFSPDVEIVQNFKKLVAFPEASSIEVKPAAADAKYKVTTFIQSEGHTYAKAGSMKSMSNLNKAASDLSGPLPVGVIISHEDAAAAATTKPDDHGHDHSKEGSTEEKKAIVSNIVVYASPLFATNAMVTQLGNEDLFLNTVSFMLQDTEMIGIRPKELSQAKLELSEERLRAVYATVLIIAGLFGVGALLASRRRSQFT